MIRRTCVHLHQTLTESLTPSTRSVNSELTDNQRLVTVFRQTMMQHKKNICHTSSFQLLEENLKKTKKYINPSQKSGWGCAIHAKPARAVQRNSLDCRRAFSIYLTVAWMEDCLRRILRKYFLPIRASKTGIYCQCYIFVVSREFSAEISGH